MIDARGALDLGWACFRLNVDIFFADYLRPLLLDDDLMKSRVVRFASLALLCSLGTTACSNAKPSMADSWPRDSSGALVGGTAIVLAAVHPDGQVASATIDKSSGYRQLDENALATVKKWRFQPLSQKGADRKVLIPVRLDPNQSPAVGSGSQAG